MKKHLMIIVKYFKTLYKIYYWIGSFTINILKFFVKPNDNLILFISFGGKKFDDSPKDIYEDMIKDNRFDGYDFVWAFQNTESFKIPRGRIIKTDTYKYYITALKARCWITNSAVERGLNFKGRNTFYFNTWHGTPIKKMGEDIANTSKSFGMNRKWDVDLMTSQSKYEADIFARVFNINRENFMICGLPRNDVLADRTVETKQSMMKKIGLPLGKKVILYAPTFREYERDDGFNCVIAPPIGFDKWKKKIGDKYVILLRAHYEVAKILNVKADDGFVYNVSDYPVLNDLMLASDMLISDYSSIFFDYSILDRPMFCYTYDYDEYAEKRGMYFDIRTELLGSSFDEEELLVLINSLNYDKALKKVRSFRIKYVQSYGNATKISLDTIFKKIKLN
ncbi:CDP-glycerol glycerophosphotransferase family protein [Clostridium estertheticum]|uniref:CDP-glycerol glycerophosphotransferase family protein n=1 Tax=Clostridium estertheticum TaxID=238834 RepID=UPI001CF54C86|nr:CDP-glycerol glycerophosphotransferase family protein [Clostridium estertheticum]MCB2339584.1 CDP-glycerol glycerophosphotransferase family protein [Clostridium estertheticum]